MDPVSARTTVPTDTILSQTMEGVSDHDPTNIQKDTGKSLHFDATTSADVRRAGLTSNGKAIEDAKTEAADHLREKVTDRAIDAAADLAGKYGPAISSMGMVAGSVVQLGSLYNSAIEKAKQEGDTQRALGASDAGVVALSQTLNFSTSFKSSVAVAHNGSSNVAAAMTASLNSNPTTQSELQFRADKGFVDAAGYAKMAAKEMKPLIDDAKSKLAAAKTADPATATTLRSQASDPDAQGSRGREEVHGSRPEAGRGRRGLRSGRAVRRALRRHRVVRLVRQGLREGQRQRLLHHPHQPHHPRLKQKGLMLMRLVPSILCLIVLTASCMGCKSAAQREREEMDRNQTATMQKLLTAAAERELEGGSPAVKPDAGGVWGN